MGHATFMVLFSALLHVERVMCSEISHCSVCVTGLECSLSRTDCGDLDTSLNLVQRSVRAMHGEGSAELRITQSAISKNDLKSLSSSTVDASDLIELIFVYGFLALLCLPVFLVARKRLPRLYTSDVLQSISVVESESTILGWATASWSLTLDDVENSVGLDPAMLLEFTHLSMKILLTLVPFWLILCPLYAVFGDGHSSDWLSWLDVTNVSGNSWLYWLHVPCVWLVVVIVTYFIYAAQEAFLDRRFRWLQKLPVPRRTTVMVESIPREFQSDGKLYDFFCDIFPSRVQEAHVVKYADDLADLDDRYRRAADYLREAEASWDLVGRDAKQRPTTRVIFQSVDSIDYYTKELDELRAAREDERTRVSNESLQVGGRNSSTGFVTFFDSREASTSVMMCFSASSWEWVLSTPPEACDLIWDDLTKGYWTCHFQAVIGYVLLASVFLLYFPVVTLIAGLNDIFDMGVFDSIYEAYGTTIALALVMALVPPVLLFIFKHFLTLKSGGWSQHKLEIWYFAFLFVFVLCITTISVSVLSTLQELINHPFSVASILADSLPYTSHYFMAYLVLQWLTHSMELTQYMILLKYFFLRMYYCEETAEEYARAKREQCNNVGQRTAKLSLFLCVALVFSTLAPLILIFSLIDMLVARVVYGYLVGFAEKGTADLGGVFWVTQLGQVQLGLATFVMLETGVLIESCDSNLPWLLVLPALFFVMATFYDLPARYMWRTLPMCKAMQEGTEIVKGARYIQPQLREAGREDSRSATGQAPGYM